MSASGALRCLHVSGFPRAPASVLSDEEIGALLLSHLAVHNIDSTAGTVLPDEEASGTEAAPSKPESHESHPSPPSSTTCSRTAALSQQEQHWQDHFDLRVVRDRETTACKGYAFVTLLGKTDEEQERFRNCVNEISGRKYLSKSNNNKKMTGDHTAGAASLSENERVSPEDASKPAEEVREYTTAEEEEDALQLTLRAEWSEPKTNKAASGSGGNKSEKSSGRGDHKGRNDHLPDLRIGRKKYPSKAKHADSVTCSDKSKVTLDAKGYVKYVGDRGVKIPKGGGITSNARGGGS
ncbi:unnamed protein product [Amoebophrya sp. A120]|nr:unnamed protein product [Amoebophrya sp. A120]|eukprot:GSA120T00017728001.1